MEYFKGVFLVLAATLFWGMSSPVAKLMVAANIHVLSAVVIRNAFVVFLLGIWFLLFKKESLVKEFLEKSQFYLIASFFSIMCNTGGYAMSLLYLSASEAIILHYTFPLFTSIASLYFAHERPRIIDIFSDILIICGVYAAVAGVGVPHLNDISISGIMWGCLSVCGMTSLVIFTRKRARSERVDQYKLLFFSNLLGGMGLFICKTILIGWADVANFTVLYLGITLFQAAASTLGAYAFFYSAFNYISAQLVSIITSFEIVVVFILSFLLINAAPTAAEIFGSALIIFAISCSAMRANVAGTLRKPA